MTRVGRKKKPPVKKKVGTKRIVLKKKATKRVVLKKKAGTKRVVSKKKKPIRAGKFIETFILCESIRNEQFGKQTLVGVYGDTVLLKEWPKDENAQVALMLSFFLRFRFIDKSKVTVRLLSPSKVELLKIEQEIGKISPDTDLITFSMSPSGAAPIPELGVYRLQVDYANKRDFREFLVRVSPAPFK